MIEQEKPENQDEGVAYVVDQMTGLTSPLEGGPLDNREKAVVEERPRRGRRPKQADEPTPRETADTSEDVASLAELGTQRDDE